MGNPQRNIQLLLYQQDGNTPRRYFLKQTGNLLNHFRGDPDMIMIDEPTEGLAPKVVEQVSRLLEEIASRGVAILLVEQKLNVALRISHRLYVMGHGQIVYEGTPATLKLADEIRSEWLEV